jgi:hypothetical protein
VTDAEVDNKIIARSGRGGGHLGDDAGRHDDEPLIHSYAGGCGCTFLGEEKRREEILLEQVCRICSLYQSEHSCLLMEAREESAWNEE